MSWQLNKCFLYLESAKNLDLDSDAEKLRSNIHGASICLQVQDQSSVTPSAHMWLPARVPRISVGFIIHHLLSELGSIRANMIWHPLFPFEHHALDWRCGIVLGVIFV